MSQTPTESFSVTLQNRLGADSATPSPSRPLPSRPAPFGCQQCGTRWSGLRIEHCKACHETFTGTSAGDMHRTGKHGLREGSDRRRCLTPDEMREKGMTQNARGQWTTGQSDPRFAEEDR